MSSDIVDQDPDPWMRNMRAGNFEAAWKVSDAALRSREGKMNWHLPRHFQHFWNGDSFSGKRVFVRCYHGLGDTIQFIRYAPLVKAQAASLIVWAQPQLIPILESMPSIDALLPLHDGTPETDFEVDVEIMELPFIFRTTLDSIPGDIPYLNIEPHELSPKTNELKVGLVWRAGNWDERRSILFSQLRSLFQINGIRMYILQAQAQSAGWQEGLGFYPGEFNLHQYARIIRGLDLMISVDSMPAHLAGATGVPVWTLLHAKPDWRWMEKRVDSPWYPTMRLFRQEQQDNWDPVIERICVELQELVGARNQVEGMSQR
jgi:hypothetical protein